MKTLLLPKISRMLVALALLLTVHACEDVNEVKTYWYFENATDEDVMLQFFPVHPRDRLVDLLKMETPVSAMSTCLLVVQKEVTISSSQLYFPDEFEYVYLLSKQTGEVLIRWELSESVKLGNNLPDNHFHKSSSWKKVLLNNGEYYFTFTLRPQDIGM